MKKVLTVMFAVATLFTSIAVAGDQKMLHVAFEIVETGQDAPAEINVNLPLTMISSMVPNIQQALDEAELQEHNINIRELWLEVRDAGPNEFVKIKNAEANVTVKTTDTKLIVHVDAEEAENLTVEIPLSLGDLLFDRDMANVNVEEIIQELSNFSGDLVVVSGAKVNGRVWID